MRELKIREISPDQERGGEKGRLTTGTQPSSRNRDGIYEEGQKGFDTYHVYNFTDSYCTCVLEVGT
jgi:hypothetical protein